jgi:transcriptional repressor NrdR
MKCPACGFADSKVIDSRHIEEGNSIRRRRECLACQKRYTTFEIVETVQIIVTKKNGTKELFDRNKLLSGLLKACQKRPVNAEDIAAEIESELQNSLRTEISTVEIGEMVMVKLKEKDEVAYVRFASVYREFCDLDTFMAELRNLKKKNKKDSASAGES